MKEVLYSEWSDRDYHREVALALAVDGERANVTYDNGVVMVALPLCTETRPAILTLQRVGRAAGQRVGRRSAQRQPHSTRPRCAPTTRAGRVKETDHERAEQ
jgi:hypothetical protein